MRKASIAAGVLAFAATGAALLGGTALADTGGAGGSGGSGAAQCLIPVGANVNLLANQLGGVAQCNGTGGAGGAGGGS